MDFGTGLVIAAIVCGGLFGVSRIPQIARHFGRATGEFEAGKIEGQKIVADAKAAVTSHP